MNNNELDVKTIFKKYYKERKADLDKYYAQDRNLLNKFEELGYDNNEKGATFFSDAVDEIGYLLSVGASEDEVRVMIPPILLDSYHFAYEVGKTEFLDKIDKFLKSRKSEKNSKNIKSQEIIPEMDIEESIVYFAKRFCTNGEFDNTDSVNKSKAKNFSK